MIDLPDTIQMTNVTNQMTNLRKNLNCFENE